MNEELTVNLNPFSIKKGFRFNQHQVRNNQLIMFFTKKHVIKNLPKDHDLMHVSE